MFPSYVTPPPQQMVQITNTNKMELSPGDKMDVDTTINKITNKISKKNEIIHSGHFMVSEIDETEEIDKNDDKELDDVVVDYVKNQTKNSVRQPLTRLPTKKYRLKNVKSNKNSRTVVSIDQSLWKLFQCMTLAYHDGLTSPKWKTFKGLKMNIKDKIRLNNIIWRAWHIQYISCRKPAVCQFSSNIETEQHKKTEAIVLEGKYWKRRIEVVKAEYNKWRIYYQHIVKTKTKSKIYQQYDWENDLPRWSNNLSFDSLFSSSNLINNNVCAEPIGQHSFNIDNGLAMATVPYTNYYDYASSRDISRSGMGADFMQPGLEQLQPNIEKINEIIDTFEPTQDFISFKSQLPTLPEEQGTEFNNSLKDLETPDELFNSIFPDQNNSNSSTTGSYQQQQPNLFVNNSPMIVNNNVVPGTSWNNQWNNLQTPIHPQNVDRSSGNNIYNPNLQTTNNANPIEMVPSNFENTSSSSFVPQSSRSMQITMDNNYNDNQANLSSGIYYPNDNEINGHKQRILDVSLNQKNRKLNKNQSTEQCEQQHSMQFIANHLANNNRNPSDLRGNLERSISLPITTNKKITSNDEFSQSQQQPEHSKFPVTSYNFDSSQQFLLNNNPNFSTSLFLMPKNNGQPQALAPGTKNSFNPIPSTNSSPSSSIGNSSLELNNYHSPTLFDQTNSFGNNKKQFSLSSKRNQLNHHHNHHHHHHYKNTSSNFETSRVTKSLSSKNKNNSGSSFMPLDYRSLKSAISAPSITNSVFQEPQTMCEMTNVTNKSNSNAPQMSSPEHNLFSLKSQHLSPSVSTSPSSSISPPLSSSSTPLIAPSYSNSMLPVSPLYKSSGDDRILYKERRRVCHINAEQKRRCNIKNGFDTLRNLLPNLGNSSNTKISKAAMLNKAADYIRISKDRKAEQQNEYEMLKQKVESLNQAISVFQSQLPTTGTPIVGARIHRIKEEYSNYVKQKTMQNWKFWIFSIIMESLLDSYCNTVSTSNFDEMSKTLSRWLDQNCSLITLRKEVLNSLRLLSTSTNILTNPEMIHEEILQAITQANIKQSQQQDGHHHEDL